jgi:hypothetical protein
VDIGRPSSVSAAVFVSADGLPLELDGLRLSPDSDTQTRLQAAREALRETVQNLKADLGPFASFSKEQKTILVAGLMASGALSLVNPLVTVVSILGGGVAAHIALADRRQIRNKVLADLAQFKSAW